MDRRSLLATSRKTAHRPVALRETVESAGRWRREASGRGGNTAATHSPGPRRRPLGRRLGMTRRPSAFTERQRARPILEAKEVTSMKLLNPELKKLEERVAPGLTIGIGGGITIGFASNSGTNGSGESGSHSSHGSS